MKFKLNARHRRILVNLAILLLFAVIVAEPVFAGSTSSSGTSNPFASMVQLLIGWLKGGLGMMLALFALGVGLVAGISRGSIVGILSGVGVAMAAYWGPDVIQGIFGAALHAQHYVTVAYI
jgi:conjugal transfer pilus assembly protein TraA